MDVRFCSRHHAPLVAADIMVFRFPSDSEFSTFVVLAANFAETNLNAHHIAWQLFSHSVRLMRKINEFYGINGNSMVFNANVHLFSCNTIQNAFLMNFDTK